MIFQEDHTTRWHDTDAFRRVTLTQMLVYMQEASNHHMESAGVPLDTLRDEKGLAFILSKMRLAVYAPLYAFEDITVQTWTCPGRAFSTERFYRIKRGNQIIADAMSTWALIDIEKSFPWRRLKAVSCSRMRKRRSSTFRFALGSPRTHSSSRSAREK